LRSEEHQGDTVNPLTSQHFRRSILTLTLAIPTITFAQIDGPKLASPTTPCKPRTSSTTTPAKPCRPKHHTDTSLSLGAFSELTIDRFQEFRTGVVIQSTAPSSGTLGTFRQTFSPWLGYSVNLGYARVAEHYLDSNGNYGRPSELTAGTNMYETSLTYIAHARVDKRFSLFGDVGPGLLTFLPYSATNNPAIEPPDGFLARDLSVQVRPTAVFGSGIDVLLSRHFTLRAEYRGLVYNNPDFRTGDTLSKRITLTSEPTFSLVYHFQNTPPFYK
jgi:opacity protein-like surface antigen